MVSSEPINYWNIPFRSWYDNASRFLWPRSKILSQSPQKIALKYWTQQFGGCRLVGFSRSPPQNFPSLLALREYFQNFHTSSQIHITDYFVNCHFQAVLCYLIYRNLWRRYLFSLSNCFKFEEKIFAAFFWQPLILKEQSNPSVYLLLFLLDILQYF